MLAVLASDREQRVRICAAVNASTPPHALERLLGDRTALVRVCAASNPNTAVGAVAARAGDRAIRVRCAVAGRAGVDPATLQMLAGDPKPAVRAAVAANRGCGETLLGRLGEDSDRQVRAAVAGNDTAPVAVLELLAADSDWWPRTAVASNPATDPDLLTVLAGDSDECVRAEVADNPNTAAGVLEVLAGDACDTVRCFVARNPALAERLLRSLATDDSECVRVGAAENPLLRSDVWAVLAADDSYFVRATAAAYHAAVSQTEALGGLRGGVGCGVGVRATGRCTEMVMVDAMTVTQRDTLAALQVLLWAGVPVLLWGDPGTGKTATVERYATEAGWAMVSVIASLHDPTDFSGLPVRDGSSVRYLPPEWACEVAAHDGVTLVFLDEVNTAAPATQNALMRMVQEHRVGYLHLGERVRFIAAANPAGQNSGAWDLSAPLANRFAHLHWPLHVNEWQSGYLDGWPTLMPLDIAAAPSPAAVRCQRRLQTAFVARRPQLLCDPPDGFVSPQGWPSPRSWDRLAYCTAAARQAQAGDIACAVIATALVGEATAAEFLAFVDNPDMPEPADLLTNPERFCELVRGDQQLVALDAIVALVEADRGLWRDAFKVCIAAADAGAGDVAASAATRLVQHKPSSERLPAGFEAFAPILTAAGLLPDIDAGTDSGSGQP